MMGVVLVGKSPGGWAMLIWCVDGCVDGCADGCVIGCANAGAVGSANACANGTLASAHGSAGRFAAISVTIPGYVQI